MKRRDEFHIRPVRLSNAPEVSAIHISSSRNVYADILPVELLAAMTMEERQRRWTEIWITASADETTLVAEQGKA
jgi:hypothetical protein